MKTRILIINLLIIGFTTSLFAQDYSNLEKVTLKDKSDYLENENLVKECSNYLLNSPIILIDNDLNHLKAMQFVIRWMEGTPDYSFGLDDAIVKAAKSNSSLLGIYMASMLKYVLENKDKSGDANEVKYNSFLTFIKYCEDSSKKVNQSKEIKKLIKAKNENTLKEYLKI